MNSTRVHAEEQIVEVAEFQSTDAALPGDCETAGRYVPRRRRPSRRR